MTKEQARQIVRRYFEVVIIANGRKFNIPNSVQQAKDLLGAQEVLKIEQEVNAQAK